MRTAEVVDMSSARVNVGNMSKMIQIRNVPDDLHRELKMGAAAAGMSLSDYLKRELARRRHKSTIREIAARRRDREEQWPLSTQEIVDTIREMTDAGRRRIGFG
jgi:plasmid stability protein